MTPAEDFPFLLQEMSRCRLAEDLSSDWPKTPRFVTDFPPRVNRAEDYIKTNQDGLRMGALCLIGKYFCCQRILETFLRSSWKIWIDHCRGKKLAQWYCGPLKTRGYFLSSPPCFSLDPPTGGVESTSLRSVCLSVITSRFRIIRNISIFGI